MSWGDMTCLGHSLGAHTCGYMGKATDGQMARVSGNDTLNTQSSDIHVYTYHLHVSISSILVGVLSIPRY